MLVLGLGLTFATAMACLQGWAIYVLWNWFLVPAGAPRLPTLAFVGAVLILELVRRRRGDAEKMKTAGRLIELFVEGALTILCGLAIGWAVIFLFGPVR